MSLRDAALWPIWSRLSVVAPCFFCTRTADPKFALTSLKGDTHKAGSWRREVLPVCPRCHRALADVGREGRVLKATSERWHMGHTVGIFESRRAPKLR